MPTISFIGAGSAVYSLNILRDFCLTPNLAGSTLRLVDINEERLDSAYRLCTRYAREVGTDLQIEKTTDRREALVGSDFVINIALAAGHHRLLAGWEIARQQGYRWGGSLAVMHDEAFWINFYQMRLFEALNDDILALCPDAYYLQVANPVYMGMTLLGRKYPERIGKMIGLCHGFGGVYHLARTLGLDPNAITFEIPGVNHFVWLTKLYHKGEDALPRLHEWVENESAEFFKTCGDSHDLGPKAVDLYRRMGVFPIGDTCTVGGGSWGWWYHADDETEHFYQENPEAWWNRHFTGGLKGVEAIQRFTADETIRLTEHFKPQHSNEVLVPMLESLACDIPRVHYGGNVLNVGGYVPGIPPDIAVEVPTFCSARGIQPVQIGGLPPSPLAYLWRDRIAAMELELQAYQHHSRSLLVELIRMDPWTRNLAQAQRLVDDILAMPEHDEMRAYYQ